MRRWIASGVAIVVAVSATIWIRDRAPHPEDWQDSFIRRGAVGEPVQLRDFTLTVDGVDGGRGLVIGGGEPWSTGGVWLVVRVTVTTDRRQAQPESVALVDDRGRRFAPTGRVNQPMTETPVQPGTLASGAIAFEVPFDVGDRVHLRAGPDDTALDAVTDIALPLLADEWAAWSADGSTVELPRRSVEAK